MRFGSIRTDILLGVIQEELDAFKAGDINAATFPRSLDAVTSEFPSLSSKERVELLRLVLTALTCNAEEKVELVVTAPNSFAIKTRTTLGAINEVLESAQKSIIMTGYSVSEYVSVFLDTVIAKSQKGIVVRLYINKVDNQASLEKLLRYKGVDGGVWYAGGIITWLGYAPYNRFSSSVIDTHMSVCKKNT